MPQVKLYIATSLDGFIAREDGDVSWLDEIPNPSQSDYGYFDFYASIGTTLMGNETYRMVQSFDVPFPYPDKTNYVFTRNQELTKDEYVTYVSAPIAEFVEKLKQETDKDIWLVGGGQINTILMQAGLIDEIQLALMPVVLGEGIPLFAPADLNQSLKLEKQTTYSSGVVMLYYRKG